MVSISVYNASLWITHPPEAASNTWVIQIDDTCRIPEGEYDFVTMQDGTIRIFKPVIDGRIMHKELVTYSESKQVHFAGKVVFNELGEIRCWSNISDTFQTDANLAYQAGLPMNKYHDWQPIKPSYAQG